MRLIFSRRERARQAAIDAHTRYPQYVAEQLAKNGVVQERWGYIVNAALDAAVGDLPEVGGTGASFPDKDKTDA